MTLKFTSTSNFTRKELKGALHPFLMVVLQLIRLEMNKPISVNRSISTFEEHKAIYEREFGDKWPEKITLKSGHLPQVYADGTISPYAHAMDFSVLEEGFDHVKLGKSIQDRIENFSFLQAFFPKETKAYGLGIGKNFIHLDCSIHRVKPAIWTY